MSTPDPALAAALQQRLTAIEIDLSSALAINGALLRGVSGSSPRMRHAVDCALDEALRALAGEERRGSAAAHAIVTRLREQLGADTSLEERMARDLEGLIVAAAAAAPGGWAR